MKTSTLIVVVAALCALQLMQGDAKLLRGKGDVLVAAKAGYALFTDQVHESITRYAAGLAGIPLKKSGGFYLMDDELIKGVRWNDMPDPGVLKADVDSKGLDNLASLVYQLKIATPPFRGIHRRKKGMAKDLDSSTIPLGQRTHYFDLQYWHGMVPCNMRDGFTSRSPYVNYRCKDFTNAQVLDLMLAQSVEWFLKSCINGKAVPRARWAEFTVEQRKNALEKLRAEGVSFEGAWNVFEKKHNHRLRVRKTPFFKQAAKSVESSEFYLGNIIHMAEDSYSGAHCARKFGKSGRLQEGPILYFQDYSAQDSGGHANADAPSCYPEFQQYWDCGGIRTLHKDQDRRHLTVDKKCREEKLQTLLQCYAKTIGVNIGAMHEEHKFVPGVKSLWSKTQKSFSFNHHHKYEQTDANQESVAPEWAAAPGAIKATQTIKRIMEIYREYTYEKAAAGSTNARCARGAEVLGDFLTTQAWVLAFPQAVAGGTAKEYGGKMCPKDPKTVMTNLADYNDWDHSIGTTVKHLLLANSASRFVSKSVKRLTGQSTVKRVHLDGLEVTCMSQCKPIEGRINRVATSCFHWNAKAQEYHLECCIDLNEEEKFGLDMTKGRADPGYDAMYIHHALVDGGTDEGALIKTLTQRKAHELTAIAQAYKKKYGETLVSAIEGDTSGFFEDILVGLVSGAKRTQLPGNRKKDNADAILLHSAIDGAGTNQEKILDVFFRSTPARLRVLDRLYKRKYGETLKEALDGDVDGHAIDALFAMFHDIKRTDATFQHKKSTGSGSFLGTESKMQTGRARLEADLSKLERDLKKLDK